MQCSTPTLLNTMHKLYQGDKLFTGAQSNHACQTQVVGFCARSESGVKPGRQPSAKVESDHCGNASYRLEQVWNQDRMAWKVWV